MRFVVKAYRGGGTTEAAGEAEVELRSQPSGGPGAGQLVLGFDPFRADFRKMIATAYSSTSFGDHTFDLEAPELRRAFKGCRIAGTSLDEVIVRFLTSEPLY